ncbi:MAG: type II secretion system protein [Clostridia bacterium]
MKTGKEQAITLIALVVTIIVLLILAGVSLFFLTGENGIITKAKLATQKNEIAQIKEQIMLEITQLNLEKKTDNPTSSVSLDEILEDLVEKKIVSTADNTNHTVATDKGYLFEIVKEGDAFFVNYIGSTDKIVPSLSYTLSTEDFTNKVTIQLKVREAINGIKEITLPDGTKNTFDSYTPEKMVSYDITANGEYTFTAISNNGNSQSEKIQIQNIDSEKPSGSYSVSTTNYTDSCTITVTGNDNNGISSITLPDNTEVQGATAQYTATENKEYVFKIKDVAGNIVEYKVPVSNIRTVVQGVVIPLNFYYVGGNAGTGLVISDVKGDDLNNSKGGNQFVWVPVDGTTVKYERQDFGVLDDSFSGYTETEDPTNKQSVNTYGGFYIGRYEAGSKEATASGNYRTSSSTANDTLICKANSIPYTYATPGDAINLSKKMYPGTTELVTGAAWDAAMNFVNKKGDKRDITNSVSWGNYWGTALKGDDGTQIKSTDPKQMRTGVTKATMANNIYDLAGGMWEWTSEKYGTDYAERGGYYGYYGKQSGGYPAAYRTHSESNYRDDTDTFRVVMYIK